MMRGAPPPPPRSPRHPVLSNRPLPAQAPAPSLPRPPASSHSLTLIRDMHPHPHPRLVVLASKAAASPLPSLVLPRSSHTERPCLPASASGYGPSLCQGCDSYPSFPSQTASFVQIQLKNHLLSEAFPGPASPPKQESSLLLHVHSIQDLAVCARLHAFYNHLLYLFPQNVSSARTSLCPWHKADAQ